LKSSRSTNRTAVTAGAGGGSARARATHWSNSLRLGRPVSGSWSDRVGRRLPRLREFGQDPAQGVGQQRHHGRRDQQQTQAVDEVHQHRVGARHLADLQVDEQDHRRGPGGDQRAAQLQQQRGLHQRDQQQRPQVLGLGVGGEQQQRRGQQQRVAEHHPSAPRRTRAGVADRRVAHSATLDSSR